MSEPQPKWQLVNGEWVIRWFILETNPFRETPAQPPEHKREGKAA